MAKRFAVLTTGRQDYGILRGVLLAMTADNRFDLRLWAGGMHLKERFGRTVEHIRTDGLAPSSELDFIGEPPDATSDAARAAEQAVAALRREKPEALVVLGDRHEVLAIAMAAAVERVPIAHLHGGEESEGVTDNLMRHALTKLSHLHLVSHERHAQRVLQMGEAPEGVVVVGAAGLDNLYRNDLPDRGALEQALGIALAEPVVLVTMHPVSAGKDATAEAAAVAAAMESVPATYVITQPNADGGGSAIRDFWLSWRRGRKSAVVVDALGESRYWGMLKLASAVMGNSSSGIIEAPEAGVPVVNVGDRQRGRLRGRGVVDVRPDKTAIADALREALQPSSKKRIGAMQRTYLEGPAAPRIISALASWQPPSPPFKRFRNLP